MNLSSAVRTMRTVITANSPVLLVGTAVAGVVATGVLAAKAGYKARGIIDDERMRKHASPESPHDTFLDYKTELFEKTPDLEFKEKASLTWLCYAAPALTGASTIASVAGVHTIHTKRHAALAGLYAVTNTKLDDYKEKAEELLGTKKTQQLNEAVAQKSVDRTSDDPENTEVFILEAGSDLFHDDWSGRWFLSSMNRVEAAFNSLNKQLVEDGDASLNDFYDRLGLPSISPGVDFGWSGVRVESQFTPVMAPDGRSAVSVSFRQAPK